jgi:hypothetical protein
MIGPRRLFKTSQPDQLSAAQRTVSIGSLCVWMFGAPGPRNFMVGRATRSCRDALPITFKQYGTVAETSYDRGVARGGEQGRRDPICG